MTIVPMLISSAADSRSTELAAAMPPVFSVMSPPLEPVKIRTLFAVTLPRFTLPTIVPADAVKSPAISIVTPESSMSPSVRMFVPDEPENVNDTGAPPPAPVTCRVRAPLPDVAVTLVTPELAKIALLASTETSTSLLS